MSVAKALLKMPFLISDGVRVSECSKQERGAGGPMRHWLKAALKGVAREAALVDLMEIFNRGRPRTAFRGGGPDTTSGVATLVNSHTFDIGKMGLNRAFATPFCYTFWSQNDR